MASAGVTGAVLLGASGEAEAAVKKPSQVLPLHDWHLTLPTGPAKAATEVYPLAGKVIPPYFIVPPVGNCVQFRAHCGGSTTPNSKYPRSELRERTANGGKAAWSTTSGKHVIDTRVMVTKVPPKKPQISLVQIHDAAEDIIILMYDGFTKSIVWKYRSKKMGPIVKNYKLGQIVGLYMDAAGGHIRIAVNGKFVVNQPHKGTGNYFKAGAYVQSNVKDWGENPNSYGEMRIYHLGLSHRK